jgi:hypothetical protein
MTIVDNCLIKGVCFSPDNFNIAYFNKHMLIKIWNLNLKKLIKTFSGHLEEIIDFIYSPDG